MKNIFLLYVPPNNIEALVHYQDTIINKVSQDRIFKHVNIDLKNKLINIFGNKAITVWGSRDSDANRSKFNRMNQGDHLLVIEGDKIKLLGAIATKTINTDLSRELWKNLRGETIEGWNLIYFIANPLEINLPFIEFKKLFKYAPNFQLRGFTSISNEKIDEFYSQYDDLYSILIRIKKGEAVIKKEPNLYDEVIEKNNTCVKEEEQFIDNKEISDHVKMQWKIIQLGLKAGSKVWVPRNDQQKIINEYKFNTFETEFTAGIDTPAKYVENIDVVWKEEFRIDAAFEIENSTAIYSGLLRFSDLKIVAPNSNYPLFVVAPGARRNQVAEQIKRPTFRKLDFKNKVRYLSYESVNEIYNFFDNSGSGLNIDLLMGKAELID